MLNLNRATIIGNMTRDPEMRYTPNGRAVVGFGVATNRRWTNQAGEQQEQVEFHEIVAWSKLAEIASQILHKGNKVYVEGRLQTRQWEAQDGSKRQRTEIIAENIIALTPRAAAGDVSTPAAIPPPASPAEPAESAAADAAAAPKDTAPPEENEPKKLAKPAKKEDVKTEDKKEDGEREISLDDIQF